MNGLLENPGMTPAGAPPGVPPEVPTETPPEAPAQGASGAPAAEVNQEEIDIFIANGMKVVHNQKLSDLLISSIVKAKNPVAAIADATLMVVDKLESSASGAQKKLSLTTIAYGSNYIMGEIIATAEAAGLKKLSDEQKAQAFSLGVGKYLDKAVQTGKMTKDELIKMGKDAEATEEGRKIADAAAKMGEKGVNPNGGIA